MLSAMQCTPPENVNQCFQYFSMVNRFSKEGFEALKETEHTFWALKPVKILGCDACDNVISALDRYNGEIRFFVS